MVGGWCPATVALVSENGRAVALGLAGALRTRDLGGFIYGVLPLIIDYDAERVTGLFGEEYEVEVAC